MESTTSKRERIHRPIAFYVVFAAALYAMIQVSRLLSPILLSFLLIILITLAVNPIVSRLRTWTGGRKQATGLVLVGLLTLGALVVRAAVVPLKQSVATLSEKLPAYWERLQKPLIKMEQQAVISEDKLQEEVSAEIARETPGNRRVGVCSASREATPVSTAPPGRDSNQTGNWGEIASIQSRRDGRGRVWSDQGCGD